MRLVTITAEFDRDTKILSLTKIDSNGHQSINTYKLSKGAGGVWPQSLQWNSLRSTAHNLACDIREYLEDQNKLD